MNNIINKKRFDNKKLHIGTYYLAPYARTEDHIKDMAECGIDFVINIPNDPMLLKSLSHYGIQAVVTGVFPNWFGGDGTNAGLLEQTNPIEFYESALDTFMDSPNIIGIDTGDEPSSLDFKHYGRIFDVIQQKAPHLQPFLNIYPSYAVKGSNTSKEIKKQLQTDSYKAYIESYCQNVTSDYVCFDYYLYSASLDGFYQTLETVSAACKKYHRQMWVVLQVNSNQPNVWISTEQLRFQAFSAMAFGAKKIIWACYTAGWWHNHVLDKEGNRTEQYEKLKSVNSEIHFLGLEYMNYHHLKTHYIDSTSILTTPFVSDFRIKNDGFLLVGEMEADNNQKALFICTSTYVEITFKTSDYQVDILRNKDRTILFPYSDDSYQLCCSPSEGVLLIFSLSKNKTTKKN